MSKRTQMLNRIKETSGKSKVEMQAIADNTGCNLGELADKLVSLREDFQSKSGGTPAYTGKSKVYPGGAVGLEIRCKKCKMTFWAIKCDSLHALCIDCVELTFEGLLGR